MPPELLTRNGVDPTEVAPVAEAFKRGEVQRALELTPPEIDDTLSVAGTPEDWKRWIEDDLAPAGFGHPLVTFAEPFLVERWAWPGSTDCRPSRSSSGYSTTR